MSFPASHEAGSSLELLQPCRQFTFSEIQLATENFDESLVIGRGGFGKVYKGTIIHGAGCLTVAIKRLESTSNQGAVEFWAEVEMLTKLRHCHLVSLIGYCKDGQEMILVYEYMPRGTLEDHLHKHLNSLPWVRRLKICIGAARGLDYLHTGTGIQHGIIHRDVKSSNILLDYSWAAKISDFGLSKIGPTNQPSTYVNTMVKGTFGYLDPNYFHTGRLTRKSDVYAFGVVLFEVLCGKRAVDRSLDEEQWGLASWAQDSIKEGRLKQIVDASIRGRIATKCLKEFAQLADRCLHSHPKKRPTMAEVVVGLESVLALQEKVSKTSQPAGMRIFGRKVPMFAFPSNGENSGGRLKSLELFFDTLDSENKVLYKFDSETISIATDYFSKANRILKHDSDNMYKGRLPNDQDIAIVRPYNDSMNVQLMQEASILTQFEHEILFNLVGYCIEGTKVLLVYEFVPYASLLHLLLGMDFSLLHAKCTLLDWKKRYNIILGVAKGLLYLHDIQIIYGNVISENIILDASLDPKLSGISGARLWPVNQLTDTIIVDDVVGNLGYIAPEYLKEGRLSYKVDVFNFGVLVLELIIGRRIDGVSETSTSIQHLVKDPVDRPTMEEVLDMLLGNSSLALPVPKMQTWMIEEALSYMRSKRDNDMLQSREFALELSPR
ncbi:serine-threonine/tyrosine-protein kinase catalytic domain-containing protein [Artemisia annua]|uniref:Serine-threonine/tyrosine-protein kinase catalytic domain-containing protein n=1 Tax=Artemisia annua TaxID=35608 RepID=A0A2U1QGV1_ARTAN|nr:serine-threonine/tyrosine-protein kinase catalytic domain-containing protein [Artemisia annua]